MWVTDPFPCILSVLASKSAIRHSTPPFVIRLSDVDFAVAMKGFPEGWYGVSAENEKLRIQRVEESSRRTLSS